MKISKQSVKKAMKKYDAEIKLSAALTFGGKALWETIKASKEAEKVKIRDENETKVVLYKDLAWTYRKAAACSLLSAMFMIRGYGNMNKRLLGFGLAYSMSETENREFLNKATDIIGEKKVQEIKDAIARDKVKNHELGTVIETGHGDTLFLDAPSGRLFRSSINHIDAAENKFNNYILNKRNASDFDRATVTWNEWYEYVDLPTITAGEALGIDTAYDEMFKLEKSFDQTSGGEPIVVLTYHMVPIDETWD